MRSAGAFLRSGVIQIAITDASRRTALLAAARARDLEPSLFDAGDEWPCCAAVLIEDGETPLALNDEESRTPSVSRVWIGGQDGVDPAARTHVLPPDCDPRAVVAVAMAAAESVISERAWREERACARQAMATVLHARYTYRTLEQARELAREVSLVCPCPDMAQIGLQELFVNGVEHGNLEINGDFKRRLLDEGNWRAEVERRLADQVYGARKVVVDIARDEDALVVTVTDDGPGFDHAGMESTIGADISGGGVALAMMTSFDDLKYLGRGNQVRATIRLTQSA